MWEWRVYVLTWVVPPSSEPDVMLLGGLEHACWSTEGTWVLTGAAGRAKALLWVWGMGRALCTGLGLGSPDFILEATRRAGIFSPRQLMTTNSPRLRWESYQSRMKTQIFLWRLTRVAWSNPWLVCMDLTAPESQQGYWGLESQQYHLFPSIKRQCPFECFCLKICPDRNGNDRFSKEEVKKIKIPTWNWEESPAAW